MYMLCVMIRGLLRAMLCIVYGMVRHDKKCNVGCGIIIIIIIINMAYTPRF